MVQMACSPCSGRETPSQAWFNVNQHVHGCLHVEVELVVVLNMYTMTMDVSPCTQ